MKIRVEKSACVGNARCQAVAPNLYPLDDEGYISIERFDVVKDDQKDAVRGARACPERIIYVEEDDGTISWPPGTTNKKEEKK